MSIVKDAVHLATLGLSVIPVHSMTNGICSCGSPRCNAPGKHPRLKWKDNTQKALTVEEIIAWWKRFPDSNVGIVTGEISGITVIDIDGEEGLRSLEEAGLPIDELPLCPAVRTGGGGYHLFYRYPERMSIKTQAGILPKVDIRSDGGFVVAPPSMHRSGNEYKWLEGRSIDDIDPVDFDFSLLSSTREVPEETEKIKPGDKWYELYLKGVGEGKRNEAAARLAGRYFSMGMSTNEVTLILEAWNANNNPPIPSKEIDTVVKSIRNREFAEEIQAKEEYMESISSLLKINLSSVKRITGDEPQFLLEFDEGACTMTTGQLLSPKSFQQSVAEATKVVVRKLSTKTSPTHDRLVQMIMNCAEDVDAGIEATGIGELNVLLKDFMSSQRTVPELKDGELAPPTGGFKLGGFTWVNLMDLVQRSGARWGVKTSIKQMAQRLRALGIERRAFISEDDTARILWGIDPAKLGLIVDTEEDA